MKPYLIVAFYKFTPLADFELMREPILAAMQQYQIKGTVILADEGVNGGFAGLKEDVLAFISYLRSYAPFQDLEFKESYDEQNPFDKSKVKLRKEIVSLGVDGIDPLDLPGEHVKPEEWNQLLHDPDVVLIDTRNDYEVKLGTFKGAINPQTLNFRDFPDYVAEHLAEKKDKKIAMFCTGGIRCEKSTSYLKKLGFEHVYQLDGGILNYIETMPKEESLWEGACFVFDNRIALDSNLDSLEKGSIDSEWKNKIRQEALQQSE